MKNSKGSAHVVVIIVLVVVILGALGFVLWNNFLKQPPVETEVAKTEEVADTTEPAQEENAKYSDNALSFEYPASGWKQVDVINADTEIVRLQTDDYAPSQGMGLDAGASVSIYRTNQQEVPSMPGVKDIEEIQVNGNKGFKYSLEYEGYRLQAFFTVNVETNDEKNYAVTMETSRAATTEEREVFDLILQTLVIK